VSTGSVYRLHFDPGLSVTGNRVARHYLGFAEHDVQALVTSTCAAGRRGARGRRSRDPGARLDWA
jgi:hypothetical protein